jgi:exopolysaccharide biosynthesis polyprenyl glycosylphosphotransferase
VDLSVVIVNWNTRSYLADCLETIVKYTAGIAYEILVVDNHSSDGSAGWLKRHFPQVHLISNDRNVGYSRANNQALEVSKGRYILFLNPDTRILGNALGDMVGFMDRHPEAGVAGCRVLNPDLSLQLACRRSFPSPGVAFSRLTGLSRLFPRSKALGRYNLTFLPSGHVAEVDAVSGSFMMVRPELFSQVGRLDERFFMYGEELDFCLRAKRAGWKVLYNPQAEIIHYKGASARRNRWRALKEFYRAMYLFHRKHYARKMLWPVNWLVVLGILTRGLYSAVLRPMRTFAMVALDALLIVGAFIIAFQLRMGLVPPHFDAFVNTSPLLILASIVCFYLFRLYDQEAQDDAVDVFYNVFRATVGAALVLVVLSFLSRTLADVSFPFPRSVFLLGCGLQIVVVGSAKVFTLVVPRRRRYVARMAVVAQGGDVGRLSQEILASAGERRTLVGFLGGSAPPGGRLLGAPERLRGAVEEYALNEVLLTHADPNTPETLKLLSDCERMGVKVRIIPGLYEVMVGSVNLQDIAGIPMIELSTDPLQGWYKSAKRLMDIAVAVAGLVVLTPLLLFIGLAIKLTSAGPVLYRQQRVGRGGAPFTMLKFRTMYVGAEQDSGPVLAEAKDARVTPLGRILRRTRLDEIPQLANVLNGQMSLVGPRPERPVFVKDHLRRSPAYERRFLLRPGMSGLAQVHGRYDLNVTDKLKYDLAYVGNVSFLLDLRILLLTLKVSLTGRGAR